MIKINLDKLREAEHSQHSSASLSINESDVENYSKIISEIFTILQNNKFQQTDDGQTSKFRYLNNIQHYLTNYWSSNHWSYEERNIIKSSTELK